MGKIKNDNVDNLKKSDQKEQKAAMLIVWTVISVTIAIVIIFPFLADSQTVLESAPTCISKSQFNAECSLCGMTRAFIEISNGNIGNAYNLNRGSLFVYSYFLLNSIVFIAYAFYYMIVMKRTAYIGDTRIISKSKIWNSFFY